jgi:hypothetical protein
MRAQQLTCANYTAGLVLTKATQAMQEMQCLATPPSPVRVSQSGCLL